MADMKPLVTFAREGQGIYTEKKSEFIAYAKPVESVAQAQAFIAEVKEKHSDARHNVYAYTVDTNSRYSDDGEPQGTAGVPILDVLNKSGIQNAVIVVTRYFGGILLGAGGLLRAYVAAAKAACDDAGVCVYDEYTVFTFSCDYSAYQLLQNRFPKFGVKTDSADFGATVTVNGAIKSEKYDSFSEFVVTATAGKSTLSVTGKRYDRE